MDESKIKEHKQLAKGIAASPGAASGIAIFDVKKAIELGEAGKKVILIRKEDKTRRCSSIFLIRGNFNKSWRKIITCCNCFKRNG